MVIESQGKNRMARSFLLFHKMATRKSFLFFNFGILLLIFLLSNCSTSSTESEICFYHWKSKAQMDETCKEALEIAGVKKIYMHYFDVSELEFSEKGFDRVFPESVLKSVSEDYTAYTVVPTVFIENRVFKVSGMDVQRLAQNISFLINQISEEHFGKRFETIQIDCDWTMETRAAYFAFLEFLQPEFQLDVTIRLHQIKYFQKTGVPPVDHGTLMLYNVGDLKNKNKNSILLASIVEQYISEDSEYPLKLHLGLPLFNQTVVFNKNDKIKLLRHQEKNFLRSNSCFEQLDDNLFKVRRDTIYKGLFLYEGYFLKTELSLPIEITSSYELIKTSKLEIDEILFFHLDSVSLAQIKLKQLISEL